MLKRLPDARPWAACCLVTGGREFSASSNASPSSDGGFAASPCGVPVSAGPGPSVTRGFCSTRPASAVFAQPRATSRAARAAAQACEPPRDPPIGRRGACSPLEGAQTAGRAFLPPHSQFFGSWFSARTVPAGAISLQTGSPWRSAQLTGGVWNCVPRLCRGCHGQLVGRGGRRGRGAGGRCQPPEQGLLPGAVWRRRARQLRGGGRPRPGWRAPCPGGPARAPAHSSQPGHLRARPRVHLLPEPGPQ